MSEGFVTLQGSAPHGDRIGSPNPPVTEKPTEGTRSNHIEWVDYAKGLAIILVVYGHSFRGLAAAGYVAAGPFFPSIDYTIYCFHMPLFFFYRGS